MFILSFANVTRAEAGSAMKTCSGDGDEASELRVKYTATTRLLAAQCDTIERLHLQVQEQQQQQRSWQDGGKENMAWGTGSGSGASVPSALSDATNAAANEPKYRRAKRLVKMQASGSLCLRHLQGHRIPPRRCCYCSFPFPSHTHTSTRSHALRSRFLLSI